MNKIIYWKVAALLIVLSLTACFHKSDRNGTADDIKHSIICHTPGGDYLVTHEEIFHATSKSSGPKGTFISGYADYRYTVRNIQTGQQAARLITGERDEDLLVLGYDGKQLWCYSADKAVGIHAREPASMLVTITREQLEKANPSLAGTLNAPTITEAPRYYSYDPITQMVVLTDLQGNLYGLDPASLKAAAIKKKPAELNDFSHAHATSVNGPNDKNISMQGEPRKQVVLDNDHKSDETFLEGEILLEQNSNRLAQIATGMLQQSSGAVQKIQQQCDSLLRLYPVLKDERQAYLNIRDANIPNRYYELQGQLERAVRDSGYKRDRITHSLSGIPLGYDSGYLYIIHANNLTDTSSMLLSRMAIKNNSFSLLWTTPVTGIYFDPSKGIKRDRMAEVFKSGNPEFRYEWFGLQGNVLVGIKMLFAFGIDINTGRLLWKQQL